MAKDKHFDLTDAISGSFSEDKAKAEKIRMDAYWQRLAESLTEPARKQLLDDLRGWNEATWEHRLHPTRSTDTTSETQAPECGPHRKRRIKRS